MDLLIDTFNFFWERFKFPEFSIVDVGLSILMTPLIFWLVIKMNKIAEKNRKLREHLEPIKRD